MNPYQPDEIYALGREILRHESLAQKAMFYIKKAAKRHSPGLKVAQMAALLSPSCGALTAQILDELRRPINRYERFELAAQLFYAAKCARVAECRIEQRLLNALNLPGLKDLAVIDYLRACDWLWETCGPKRRSTKK